ncbi:MAG: PEGA domain-containing protein [Euryarchaeota archaeon]|nr:PEGA domain-containing protein [Euryarchaeota archaeon]
MMRNRIMIKIFTGLLLLLCIGGVHGAVITIDGTALAGNSEKISVSLDEAQAGLAGYKIQVTFSNPTVEITKVEFPSWAVLKSDDPKPPTTSVVLTAVDLQSEIQPGTRDVDLFTVEIQSDGSGHQMQLDVKELTDHSGNPIPTAVEGGSGSHVSKPPTTQPTAVPTTQPTTQPTAVPTTQPTSEPTTQPTAEPTSEPTVVPTPEPLAAAFTFEDTRSFYIAPTTFHFEDQSTGNPEAYFWKFGDGETSVVQNPQHTYRKPGLYTVSLIVSKGSETSTATSDTVIHIIEPRPIPIPRQNGILAIGSIPQGADIYLNGAYYGQTPIRIPNLTPNRYQVRLVKPGYHDSVTTIPVFTPSREGVNGPVPSYGSVILLKAVPPNVGKIVAEPSWTGSAYIVTYPKEVDIYFEGMDEPIGSSDVMITRIPIGEYNITLKRDGFADWPGQIKVLTGKTVMQVYHYDYPTYGQVASEYFDQPEFAEESE